MQRTVYTCDTCGKKLDRYTSHTDLLIGSSSREKPQLHEFCTPCYKQYFGPLFIALMSNRVSNQLPQITVETIQDINGRLIDVVK